MSGIETRIAHAITSHGTLPAFPEALTLAQGYDMQARVVDLVAGAAGIAGLKAGLTTPAQQAFFSIDHPLLGRLYAAGRLASGVRLDLAPAFSIECEVGVFLDAAGEPASVCPAIELVSLNFARREDASAPNLVACNVAADRFILGAPVAWPGDFSELEVGLTRDDEVLVSAPLTEAMGGPDVAVPWMLGEAERRDITVPAGALFMTGTCGGAIPASAGRYVADYGKLGIVEFTVAANA